jgi:hypothetical protein
MGKTQSRRSISIRGSTYERLRVWCETHGTSMSEFIETRITEHIGPDLEGKAYRPLPAVSQIARAHTARPAVAPRLPAPPQRAPEDTTQPRLTGTQRAAEQRPTQRPVREAESPAASAEPVRPSTPRMVETPRPVETLRPAARSAETPRPGEALRRAAISRAVEAARSVEAARPVESLRPAAISRAVEATRPIRMTQPPAPMEASVGRPAPTPATEVLKVYGKEDEPRDTTDYREIRF